MERWNSTSQIQGTAGNREAGGLVNIAVTMKLLKDYPLWKLGVQIKSSAQLLSTILDIFDSCCQVCHTLDNGFCTNSCDYLTEPFFLKSV